VDVEAARTLHCFPLTNPTKNDGAPSVGVVRPEEPDLDHVRRDDCSDRVRARAEIREQKLEHRPVADPNSCHKPQFVERQKVWRLLMIEPLPAVYLLPSASNRLSGSPMHHVEDSGADQIPMTNSSPLASISANGARCPSDE
jgi:hypothetical protein